MLTYVSSIHQVSGPESKRKAVEAGLLKTVIDLLETPEPVQVILSCLFYDNSDVGM